MAEDCYIYWDGDDVPEKERMIYFQCVNCYSKNKKGKRWNKEDGYGKNTIICYNCDTVINQYVDNKK